MPAGALIPNLTSFDVFKKKKEDRIVMNILRVIGEGARRLTNIYMEVRMGEELEKELRQTNIFGYYGRKGGKGADAPFDIMEGKNKGNRNTIKKKKKIREDKKEILRVGGWIQTPSTDDYFLWEWRDTG